MIDTDLIAAAERITSHRFSNPGLAITALTHSSIATSRLASNERLEFLGDAILGMVVCADLYNRFPDWLEGDLTKVKSMVVSRRVCADIADELGLTGLLILGNGIGGNGDLPTSLRAAVFESLIGAVCVDGGVDVAEKFILSCTDTHIIRWSASEHRDNHKSALQQYAQRFHSTTPRYEALDEKGPDHSKCFEICVVIKDRRFPSAWGTSKKEAEQEAAKRAMDILQTKSEPPVDSSDA